jgi:hypothetical protein
MGKKPISLMIEAAKAISTECTQIGKGHLLAYIPSGWKI